MSESPAPPDSTRSALIAAGIKLFGSQGFAATSVRQLAAEAEANIAAIAYHFGGKEGLRLACAEEFGQRMGVAMAAAASDHEPSPAEAREELRRIVRAMLAFLLGGKGVGEMVPFMLRELAEGGPGLAVVYERFAEPKHRRLCWLWGRATGAEAESQSVRLALFSLIGQIMYFRIGQPVVARRMGWDATGPEEVALIAERIIRNLDAMLDAEGGS